MIISHGLKKFNVKSLVPNDRSDSYPLRSNRGSREKIKGTKKVSLLQPSLHQPLAIKRRVAANKSSRVFQSRSFSIFRRARRFLARSFTESDESLTENVFRLPPRGTIPPSPPTEKNVLDIRPCENVGLFRQIESFPATLEAARELSRYAGNSILKFFNEPREQRDRKILCEKDCDAYNKKRKKMVLGKNLSERLAETRKRIEYFQGVGDKGYGTQTNQRRRVLRKMSNYRGRRPLISTGTATVHSHGPLASRKVTIQPTCTP